MAEEIEDLQAILREDPYNFQARRTLSIALLDAGFNEEAKKNLLYLIRSFPDNAELLYNLGIAYEKLKQFEKAENAYIRAIEISPETDFFYNLGITFIEEEKYEEAIPVFKKVLEAEPDDSNSYFNLGLCYFKTREFDSALENFQKTIELNDSDLYAHFYIGNIFKEEGLLELAVEQFNKVLSLSPDYSWAYFNLGSIAYEMGETENAIFYLKSTIQYNHLDLEAYKILNKIYLKQERYMEATDLIKDAMEAIPQNGDLYYNYAQIFKSQGDIEKWQKALAETIKNHKTLTYPFDGVKKELKEANAILKEHQKELPPQPEAAPEQIPEPQEELLPEEPSENPEAIE